VSLNALPDPEDRPWMPIPEAGQLFGLGRSASYSAAARGELPTMKIGARRVVVVARLRAMLGLEEGQDNGAATP
jgi:hypothetical protein